MKQIQNQPPVAYSQPERLECIDSLRGLASLAVLLGHLLGTFAWPAHLVSWSGWPFINMMFDGRSAVTMFFILSGFVLAHPYLAPAPAGHTPRPLYIPTFYLRRITRIWLPWFAVFVLSLVAQRYCYTSPVTIPPTAGWLGQFWRIPPTFAGVLQQCVFELHDARRMLLPQDWSLGVELRGSAFIPLFLWLVRKHVSFLAGIALWLLIFHPTGQYYVSFALGVCAAKYYHRVESRLRALNLRTKCGLLMAGVCLYESRWVAGHFCDVNAGWGDKTAWCLASAGCVFILAASLSSRRIQAKLNLPPVLFLGRISYSLYLLQFMVILCLLPPLVHQLNALGLHNPVLLLPLTVGMGVLFTVIFAAVSYRLVEMPSMDLGRWLTRLVQRRLARGPAPQTPQSGVK